MPLAPISYWNLPIAVRNKIEDTTGSVTSAKSVGEGLNSSVATLVQTPTGHYFVKALPSEHRWVWTQEREAKVAQYVGPVAPALCTRVVDHGWDALVFEALEGHRADYAPGSPDLRRVADLLTRIGELACPDIPLRQAEERLQAHADASDLHYFAGDALLHTDLNDANVIIGVDRARIVDWGWATRGAPWLDAAYWVIWLIAAGHEPAVAEGHAANVAAWKAAPDAGVDAFAAANAHLWTAIAGPQPDAFTKPIVNAARLWHRHRSACRQ